MILSKTKPATAGTAGGLQKTDQAHNNARSNTPKPAAPQAPDFSGESDFDFFRARPGATRRLRFPFADEFPIDLTEQAADGVALISVRMDRDEFGQPVKRVRAIFFREGGRS